MKKKSEKKHLGLVREAICRFRGKAGHLRMWDCKLGAPMGMGEANERWAVEWVPGGRGEGCHVHLRTIRIAQACLRGIAAGKADQWGLFELPENKEGRDVPKTEVSDQGGGGGGELAVVTPGMPLTRALMLAFDAPYVIEKLKEMLDATRPVYASEDGSQKVVDHEPDWATRRDAMKLLLSYRDGMPIKRTEEIKSSAMTGDAVMARMMHDRKSRAAFAKYLKYLDAQDDARLEGLGAPLGKPAVVVEAE
jgi:hypothetical protein